MCETEVYATGRGRNNNISPRQSSQIHPGKQTKVTNPQIGS